jgi:hypothetical protein
VTFAELKQELVDRGFHSLTDARQGFMINRARADLDGMYCWPYREASVTGSPPPLVITDLGDVQAVVDMTTGLPLQHVDYATLLESYGDLSIPGTPAYWYRGTPAGIPEIATYPVSTGIVGVQYWRVTPDLTGTQVPAAPSRFHGLIVDMAVRRAYQDNDAHGDAGQLGASIQADLAAMVNALLLQDQVMYQRVVSGSEDW